MNKQQFEILNYYFYCDRPVSGLVKNGKEHYWFRIIESSILENPKGMDIQPFSKERLDEIEYNFSHSAECRKKAEELKVDTVSIKIEEEIEESKKEETKSEQIEEEHKNEQESSDEDSDSSLSFKINSDEEEEEYDDRVYQYSLFPVSPENLVICIQTFENMDMIKYNRVDCVRRYNHEVNLDSLFNGDFITIDSTQFSNFYQPRMIFL